MKTLELLDKYQKIIAGRLNCNPEHIKFYINGEEVGSIDYEKKEEWEENYISNWALGEFQVFIDKKNELPQYFGDKLNHKSSYLNIKHYNKLISDFKLYQLPHCCAYAVSCKARVYEKFRNNRIGTILNSFRQDVCRILGYSALMCTDIETNKYQRKLLKTNGWKDVHNLINKRTNNRVFLSLINL